MFRILISFIFLFVCTSGVHAKFGDLFEIESKGITELVGSADCKIDLINKSNSPVEIIDISSSCSCAGVSYNKKSLASKERLSLSLKVVEVKNSKVKDINFVVFYKKKGSNKVEHELKDVTMLLKPFTEKKITVNDEASTKYQLQFSDGIDNITAKTEYEGIDYSVEKKNPKLWVLSLSLNESYTSYSNIPSKLTFNLIKDGASNDSVDIETHLNSKKRFESSNFIFFSGGGATVKFRNFQIKGNIIVYGKHQNSERTKLFEGEIKDLGDSIDVSVPSEIINKVLSNKNDLRFEVSIGEELIFTRIKVIASP